MAVKMQFQANKGGRRSSSLLTYNSPNHLKVHIDVSKRLYYENLLPDNQYFSCGRCKMSSKLTKLDGQ